MTLVTGHARCFEQFDLEESGHHFSEEARVMPESKDCQVDECLLLESCHGIHSRLRNID